MGGQPRGSVMHVCGDHRMACAKRDSMEREPPPAPDHLKV